MCIGLIKLLDAISRSGGNYINGLSKKTEKFHFSVIVLTHREVW